MPSTFPLARKFPWGQLPSFLLQSTWERWPKLGAEGVLRHPHPLQSRLRALGSPDCGGLGTVAGPLTLCSLLPLSSPQVGFLRFLFLISTFDWKNNPLIVNLNNELTGKWYDESQTTGRTTPCGLQRRAGKGFSLLTQLGMSTPDSGCLGVGKC